MDNWVKLLLLVELSLSIRYYNKKKIKSIKSLNGKALDKLTWLRKFRKDFQLKEGNKVYFLIRNFRNKKSLKKLDYIKIKPFLVNKQVDVPDGQLQDNYYLKLPLDIGIHLVFNILFLELVDLLLLLQEIFYYKVDDSREYKFKKIIKIRGNKFEIKWKGYLNLENILELLENLI